MGENDFNLNLKTLKEIILDEQRLVTYITLSKELCVHVNEAKLLLKKAVEDIKIKQPNTELNITYIVSGLSDTYRGQTTVCSETDLNRIKKTFETIFFLHIYSLSKGPSSLDRISLLTTNKLDDLPLCIGLIKNDTCSKRTLDEKRAFKLDSQSAVNDFHITKLQQTNTNKSQPQKLIKKQENVNKEQNDKKNKNDISVPEIIVKKEVLSPKKISTGNRLVNKNGGGNGSKSIAGFFNKLSTVSNTQTKIKYEEIVKEEPIKKEIQVNEMETDVSNIKTENDNKEIQSKHKLDTKALSGIKKDSKVDKKRKRLLHISDSESDSEKNDPFTTEKTTNYDSEDEIPPTPDQCIKITSGIVNPKKRRKIIDKTYVDDEGYILTKKEEVYESCSENEDEIHKKENVNNKIQIKAEISPKEKKTKNKKKSLSPQKGKQTTMMTFFKKV